MKIAINKTVINKPDDEQKKKMTFTYENVDITANQLAEYVNQGYAFCAQHKNKQRKTTNFLASDFLAVDIDDGMTVSEALNDDHIQDHASFLYTTPSHTDDFPRFRVVFALQRTITKSNEMKYAYSGLVKMFGGDPSCTDACRQFFGSKDDLVKIFANTLPNPSLDKLILLGKEATSRTENKAGNKLVSDKIRSTIRSDVTIDNDTTIIDKLGGVHRLVDLPPGITVHCPVHIDKNASAFTVISKNGVLGVHCSTCRTTYFTSSDMPLYDFNYSLNQLKSIDSVAYTEGLLSYEKNSVIFVNEKYLPTMTLDSQYVFVKSPKGSGKTQWLERVVADCKRKRRSVLLIGHRQSLISSIANRLGLTPYINFYTDDINISNKNNKPSKYYAICADSLPKLLTPSQDHYDVVLIDEVEQVLSHLTENTVKDKRNEVFLYFKHFVKSAGSVYVMDADLNTITVDGIINFGSLTETNWNFVVNEYKQPNRVLDLYYSNQVLMPELIASLARGEKCFVCSNSKSKIGQITKIIYSELGEEIKAISITSDNSFEESIQCFIRDIKTRILDYDVVLVSPSVGTGVDITFPNNASLIDCVYGFFESRINTHFDIDQQICRVRHPKAIKIAISPKVFRFEFQSEIIKREVLESSQISRRLIDISNDGALQYDDDWSTEYLDLYANVTSMKRGSKNNLAYHFKKMKEHYGWTVNEITGDLKTFLHGLNLTRLGRELQEEEKIKLLLDAKLITREEYTALEKISSTTILTADQFMAMRRFEIESFYYSPITKDLILLDDDGRFRYKVREYENYIGTILQLKILDIADESRNLHFTDKKTRLMRRNLLRDLFVSAHIADENSTFFINQPLEGNQLSGFVACFRENKDAIARYFNMDINRDIDSKPMSQLGKLIRLVGLSWTRKTRKKNGGKIYQYSITESDFEVVDNIASRRSDSKITMKWHEERNNTSDNRLLDLDTSELYTAIKEQIRKSRRKVYY